MSVWFGRTQHGLHTPLLQYLLCSGILIAIGLYFAAGRGAGGAPMGILVPILGLNLFIAAVVGGCEGFRGEHEARQLRRLPTSVREVFAAKLVYAGSFVLLGSAIVLGIGLLGLLWQPGASAELVKALPRVSLFTAWGLAFAIAMLTASSWEQQNGNALAFGLLLVAAGASVPARLVREHAGSQLGAAIPDDWRPTCYRIYAVFVLFIVLHMLWRSTERVLRTEDIGDCWRHKMQRRSWMLLMGNLLLSL